VNEVQESMSRRGRDGARTSVIEILDPLCCGVWFMGGGGAICKETTTHSASFAVSRGH
jgi:hypothetical protein